MTLAKIWVFAEATDGKVSSSTLEILTKARELATTVEAVYAGGDADAVAEVLGAHGATTVHTTGDLGGALVGVPVSTMRGPDGVEYPNRGVYLEVVPNERLVFTDAYTRAWEPSEKPFMTAVLTFEDAGPGKTLYTARVRHWTSADCEAHKNMGFHESWGIATTQMEALASRI